MNPLTLAMTGTGQEAMEPSSDMGPNDFGTSHRVGGAGGQAYGYYKSLIYTISNSNSEDAYFKVAWNGKNTGYTDSF